MSSLKIAVTGGIGSGKSAVCEFIRQKGFTVYSADKTAKEIMSTPEIKKSVIDTFGLKTDKNGGYDKTELAKKVFGDRKSLELLNSLVHPPTMKAILDSMQKHKGAVFAEIPLLFESRTQNLFDYVLIVMRDKEKRIQAVADRDNLSRAEIEARMKNQFNYEKIPKIEHTIIYNDLDLQALKNKVDAFLGEIVKNTH